MSRSDALTWLRSLADAAPRLAVQPEAPPYWSQRNAGARSPKAVSATAIRIRGLVGDLEGDGYFAESFGYDCVDDPHQADTTPEAELARRVGKPHLWTAEPEEWDDADLCDFVEVMHDLAARPTLTRYHNYADCGWHPVRFSRRSGQRLYRWRMNAILAQSTLGLRIADNGPDRGRLVRTQPAAVGLLIDDVLDRDEVFESDTAIKHAIGLYRARSAKRDDRRSAVVELAGVLERRRGLLKASLSSRDEAALFHIANSFDIRHRDEAQLADYDDDFLDWIFAWYLATVDLTDRLLSRREEP